MNCQDHLYRHFYRGTDPRLITRRWFFQQCGVGLGAIALGQLLRESGFAAPAKPSALNPLAPRQPHFNARAKRVIYLFMAGAPSHLELFDHKPQLAKFDGTLPPADLVKDYRAAFINPNSKLLGPKFKFSRHGRCGAELSELLPNLAQVVDDIAIVKSMVTDAFNHAPGQILMSTGSQQFGRPSLGAWVSYGLGSENENLPGFVVLLDNDREPPGGNRVWGTGFMPATFQGTRFRSGRNPGSMLFTCHQLRTSRPAPISAALTNWPATTAVPSFVSVPAAGTVVIWTASSAFAGLFSRSSAANTWMKLTCANSSSTIPMTSSVATSPQKAITPIVIHPGVL